MPAIPAPATRPSLASLLSSTLGLDYHVALNWLGAENSSHPTNPLGIRAGNSAGSGLEIGRDSSGFAVYRSAADGIRAAAWLVLNGPYEGIRKAIASGSPTAQRAAIVASPWAGGNYNGGTGFSSVGIGPAAKPAPAASSIPQLVASVRIPPATSSTTSSPGGTVSVLGLTFTVGAPITDQDKARLIDAIANLPALQNMGLEGSSAKAVIMKLVYGLSGAWSQSTANRLAAAFRQSATEAKALPEQAGGVLSDAAGAAAQAAAQAAFGALSPILVDAAILFTILGLGAVGIRKLLG